MEYLLGVFHTTFSKLCGQDHTNSRAFNIDSVKENCYPQSLRAYKKSLVSQGLLIEAARLQRKEDAALFKDLRHRITLLASPLINWLYSD
jgi:hypothetical protein